MRIAAQQRVGRNAVTSREPLLAAISERKPIAAPVGGLNARDSLAAMKAIDAVRLINWYPRPTYCESRDGASDYATGLGANAKSLMNWSGPTSNKFYVGTSAGIYDVSVAGAVGAVVKACTNGKFQWVQYATASGDERLVLVNGVDKMIYFDGTTWASIDGVSAPIAVTGVTTTNIIHVNIFKQRLFFIEKNKLSFWYLPIQSLGGAAVEFQMNTLFSKGGYVMAMGTWTLDAGAGPDDRAVFISSEGEVVVFQGTDPSNPALWALVGVFFVGKPLGRRCFTKLGGDLVLLLEQGAFPLSQALLTASVDRTKALTNKIELAFLQQTSIYSSVFGWEALSYPGQGAIIINVPNAEDGLHYQYVMNTSGQRWCQFSGWNAECFGLYNGGLYFGIGTKVAKAWSGPSDFGSNIILDAKPAFNALGSDGEKYLEGLRPIFSVSGPISFLLGCDVDFSNNVPVGLASYTVGNAALWDVGVLDTSFWTADSVIQKDWKTPAVTPGVFFAPTILIGTNAVKIQWMATDFLFQRSAGALV